MLTWLAANWDTMAVAGGGAGWLGFVLYDEFVRQDKKAQQDQAAMEAHVADMYCAGCDNVVPACDMRWDHVGLMGRYRCQGCAPTEDEIAAWLKAEKAWYQSWLDAEALWQKDQARMADDRARRKLEAQHRKEAMERNRKREAEIKAAKAYGAMLDQDAWLHADHYQRQKADEEPHQHVFYADEAMPDYPKRRCVICKNMVDTGGVVTQRAVGARGGREYDVVVDRDRKDDRVLCETCHRPAEVGFNSNGIWVQNCSHCHSQFMAADRDAKLKAAGILPATTADVFARLHARGRIVESSQSPLKADVVAEGEPKPLRTLSQAQIRDAAAMRRILGQSFMAGPYHFNAATEPEQ